MNRKKSNGFTLIELIIVLAVLAILLIMATPSFAFIKTKTDEAICNANVKVLQNAYFLYADFEGDEAITNHDQVVDFLAGRGLISEYESFSCPSGGQYILVDRTVCCTIHKSDTATPTPEITSVPPPSTLYTDIDYLFTTSTYYGGFSYTLKLINLSSNPVKGWVAEFEYPGVITACWTGLLENLGGHCYRITCYDYNYYIASGSSLTIQGQGTTYGGNSISKFLLKKTYDSIDASATFTITSSWKSGFNFEIEITNHGSQNITGWDLAFNYDGIITRAWDAVLTSSQSGRFIFANPQFSNITIPPGGTIQFGGQGTIISNDPPTFAVLNETKIPIS